MNSYKDIILPFLRSRSKTFYAFAFLFLFAGTVVLAAPPGSPYTANQTLDPSCGPTDTNCYVAPVTVPTNVSSFTNDAGYLTSSSNLAWTNITTTPTTLGGYGITDAAPITGSANYIQNTGTQQTANLNINGNGYFGGNIGIGTTSPQTKLVVSYNSATVSPNFPLATGLQIVGPNATPTVEEIDTFGEHGLLEVRRANGTPAAPSGLLANDHISSFAAGGYGTTQYNAEASANIAMFADENWTDTAHGTFIYFDTTPDGTTNLTPVAKVEQNGNYDVSGNMIVGQMFGASLFGYTSPIKVLSVIGSSSTTSRAVLELAAGTLNTSAPAGEVDFDATSQSSASNYRLAQIYGTPVGSTTGNVGGSLTFTTKADGGSASARMTISNTGVVAIPGLSSNGLVKTSSGTGALSIATAGTDYQAPITLTTIGSSGAATFSGNTLNIPQYAGGGGGGTVTSVATDSTLTGGTITTSGTLGLNLANANIFTGIQTVNKTAIATTSTDGLVLENTTAATSGATVQYSPRLHWMSNSWNTTSLASQTQDWIAELRPGSANPTSSKLVFAEQVAGGGYVDVLTLNSSGTVSTGSANNGAINVGAITSTATLVTGSSNGNIWVPAATAATSTAASQYQFAGSSTSFLRTGVYGNSIGTVLTASAPYGSFVVGASPISVAATGTQPLLANMVVTALGTVTNSSSIPVTTTASLYVNGAGSGGTNNYALDIASGNSVFGGQIGAVTLAAGTANSLCYSTTALTGFNTLATCSSDERLKQNITPLPDNVLTNIMKLNPVSFNWNPTFSADQTVQFGLIAQQVAQVFPNLVSKTSPTSLTPDGTYSINFNGLYSPIIKSIQEMNLNITDIDDLTKTNSWRDALENWFADTANSISAIVADKLEARNEICIQDVCVTKQDFQNLIQERQQSQGPSTPAPVNDDSDQNSTTTPSPDAQSPEVTPAPVTDPIVDSSSSASDTQSSDVTDPSVSSPSQ